VMFNSRPVYFFAAVVRAIVGAVHWSRGVGYRVAVGVRRGQFSAVHPYVG